MFPLPTAAAFSDELQKIAAEAKPSWLREAFTSKFKHRGLPILAALAGAGLGTYLLRKGQAPQAAHQMAGSYLPEVPPSYEPM